MAEDICFIVNPKSGTGKWKGIEDSIRTHLGRNFSPRILFTQRAGEARELAKQNAVNSKIIVAVGGDGIVNEVAGGILGSGSALGIVPAGSGNAVAGHLGIPLSHRGAIDVINKRHVEHIDVAQVNNQPFLAVAGTGFDAEIADRFAHQKKRGFLTYLRLSALKYIRYKPVQYAITIDDQKIREEAFLISVANGSQYGNKAYIAPQASMKDGLLEVCILRPFPKELAPILVSRLFLKRSHHSSYLRTIKGKDILIQRTDGIPCLLHYDGEPGGDAKKIMINVMNKKLNVIVGKNKKNI